MTAYPVSSGSQPPFFQKKYREGRGASLVAPRLVLVCPPALSLPYFQMRRVWDGVVIAPDFNGTFVVEIRKRVHIAYIQYEDFLF